RARVRHPRACAEFGMQCRQENLDSTSTGCEHAPMHTIDVVDSHTGGEPTRVVTAGFPDLGQGSMVERLQRFRQQYDHWRRGIVLEPRGSDTIVGACCSSPMIRAPAPA